jgi:hypothetical protein
MSELDEALKMLAITGAENKLLRAIDRYDRNRSEIIKAIDEPSCLYHRAHLDDLLLIRHAEATCSELPGG